MATELPGRVIRPDIGANAWPRQRTSRLSRHSAVPLYFQLAAILEERIASGRWKPGDRFLSEQELCDEFAVSRAVVRPAVAILEAEGRLKRLRGQGTFVAEPKASHSVGGLTFLLREPPAQLTIDVLEVVDDLRDPEIALALGTDGEAQLARATGVATFDGRPLFVFISFIAPQHADAVLAALVPGGQGAAALRELELTDASAAVESSFATEFEAEQLDISVGSPVLMVRCVERAADGTIEIAWLVYRADVFEFDLVLAR
jgi:GntR family transcriptional regulator